MPEETTQQRIKQVSRLLSPRNVVIVGATERPTSWAGRIRRNLQRFGFPGKLYAVNPRYDALWGEPCYPDLASLPEPPDHLVLLTPARSVGALLDQGSRVGAGSATIFASGFGEDGSVEGSAYAGELREVIGRTGMAVSGPNCLGNVCADSRLVTLTDRRLIEVENGPVAVVAQSGGIAMSINRRLTERGVRVGYVITSGNETGLTTPDYLDYFVSTGRIRVVALFVEGLADPERFLASARRAQDAGVRVVVMKIGGSERSRKAAQAHTGALAGSLEAFDAVASRVGVLRVDTVDEVIEAADCLSTCPQPTGEGMAAITFSGGARGLLEESAVRRGVQFAELEPSTLEKIGSLLGVGGGVGNPVDSGYTGLTNKEAYLQCVDALIADPNVDILLAQGELPQGQGGNGAGVHKDATLGELNRRAGDTGAPILVFSLAAQNISEPGRDMRRSLDRLGFVQGPDQAVGVAGLLRKAARSSGSGAPTGGSGRLAVAERARDLVAKGPDDEPWNELDSKALLAEYGIRGPREVMATSSQEAVQAAGTTGYPVTLKMVLAGMGHKSDVGGVLLKLPDEAAVRDGYAEIERRAERHQLSSHLQGVLVAEHIEGGIELALGIHRDVEMGPVVMVGLGGTWLEVLRDVAFGPVPLGPGEAEEMIRSTRAHQLLAGVRGSPPLDRTAIVEAIVSMSRLASDCEGLIGSVDVNPFTVLQAGKGGVALDALVVPLAVAVNDGDE